MSWEAQAWAAKQKTGSSSSKLVLMGLASCASSDHCAFPSIKWLCEFSELDRKTVIEALKRLTAGLFPLIKDTGERKGRTKQVKVYRLASYEAQNATHDRDVEETVPKAEQSRKRNSSGSSPKASRKRNTEPSSNHSPLSPKGDSPPRPVSKKGSGRRKKAAAMLPDDWTPPPTDDLSSVAIQLVRQWPVGAYQAVCEAFRLHYQTTGGPAGMRGNWNDVLSKWIVGDHPKIMRDHKAGVSFAALAPTTGARPKQTSKAVAAKSREDDTSERIHSLVRLSVGQHLHSQWFGNAAIIWDEGSVTVFVASEFVKQWILDRLVDHVGRAAREATGCAVEALDVVVEDSRG